MANPNLAAAGLPVVADFMARATLASGDNDYTVPTGKAWKPASGTVCNKTSTQVAVVLSTVVGGVAVQFASFDLPGNGLGDSRNAVDFSEYMPAFLPEGATIRVNAATGSAVDLIIAGTVLG